MNEKKFFPVLVGSRVAAEKLGRELLICGVQSDDFIVAHTVRDLLGHLDRSKHQLVFLDIGDGHSLGNFDEVNDAITKATPLVKFQIFGNSTRIVDHAEEIKKFFADIRPRACPQLVLE
jgi:hypothetical protein